MSFLLSLTEMAAAQTCGNCGQPMGGNHFYRKVNGKNKRFCKGSAIKAAKAAGMNPKNNVSFPAGSAPPPVHGGKAAPAQPAQPAPAARGPRPPTSQPAPAQPTQPAPTQPAPAQPKASPANAAGKITKVHLEAWLKDIGIKPDEYEVVNGRLNIKTSVLLTEHEYTQLPVPFGKVDGNFEIAMPTLKTTKNFPEEIEGNLTVYNTDIENLDDLNIAVGGGIHFGKNENLKNFRKVHKRIKSVGSGVTVDDLNSGSIGGLGFLMISGIRFIQLPNLSKAEEIMSKYFGKDGADLLDIQEELIDSGYKNIARI